MVDERSKDLAIAICLRDTKAEIMPITIEATTTFVAPFSTSVKKSLY